MAQIALRQIDHSFSGHRVLKKMDLCIESGQYVVLLGESGCGKTTTLRMIAGLQHPDSGDVLIDRVSVVGVPARKRDVSLVFQQDALYPHLTIRDAVGFSLRGLPSDQRKARVDEAASITGMDSMLDRMPHELSGGQQRRASLAKAIARRAKVRLLDEPLSALDWPVRLSIQDALLQWHRAHPGTTLHVTHDGHEAIRIADQVAVMHDGRIVQQGSPAQIARQPATVSLLQSISTTPLNQFTARTKDSRWTVDFEGIELQGITTDHADHHNVIIAVASDHWRVIHHDTQQSPLFGLRFTGVVHDLHNSGSQVHAEIGTPNKSFSIRLSPSDASTLRRGDKFAFGVQREHVHLFNAADGMRMAVNE